MTCSKNTRDLILIRGGLDLIIFVSPYLPEIHGLVYYYSPLGTVLYYSLCYYTHQMCDHPSLALYDVIYTSYTDPYMIIIYV